MAVALFSESRPPGIYKQDYLNELYERYADDETIPKLLAPAFPQWDHDVEHKNNPSIEDVDTGKNNAEFYSKANTRGLKRPRIEETKLNAQFAEPNIAGIEVSRDSEEISRIQREIQNICNWNG
jgi:mRNA-capping enzyme